MRTGRPFAPVVGLVALVALAACTSDDSPEAEPAASTTTAPAPCLGLKRDVDELMFADADWLDEGEVVLLDEVRRVDGVESAMLLDPDETWSAIESVVGGGSVGSRPQFSPGAVAVELTEDADHARVGEELSVLDGYEGGFLRLAPESDLVFRPGRWGESDVVIFFDPSTETAAINAVRAEVEARPGVDSVRYLDQTAAYDEFVELFADSPELVATVSPDLLPASLRVLVQEDDLEEVEDLASAFEDAVGVRDVVVDPAILERTLGLTAALSGC
jgi:cell division protein FtsX